MSGSFQIDNCCSCGTCSSSVAGYPLIQEGAPTPITSESDISFGTFNFQPGDYVVGYCKGSWSYSQDPLLLGSTWMVTQFPAFELTNPWNGGFAIFVDWTGASGGQLFFPEAIPPGGGYATPAIAEAHAAGIFVTIQHPGGALVPKVHFTDRQYTDNTAPPAPDTTPRFGLYGKSLALAAAIQPGESCVVDNGDGTLNVYLGFTNVSGTPRTNMGLVLTAPGMTVLNNPQVFTSLTPGQSAFAQWTVRYSGPRNIAADVEFVVYGGSWGHLTFDLTPTVIVDSIAGIGIDHACIQEQQRVDVTAHMTGFQPLAPAGLNASISGAAIAQVDSAFTCAAQNPVPCGTLACGPGGVGGFSFDLVMAGGARPATIAIQIQWLDGAATVQTSTYSNVPMRWA